MIHEMKLRNWPFNSIKNGDKIYELRLYDEKRRQISRGDIIEFTNIETAEKITVEVINLHLYKNFEELYKNIDKTLIGYKKDETASYKDMEKFYSKEEQERYSVVAIEIKLIL